MRDPKTETTEEIVAALLVNKKRQYTEAAHAEIFNRLITTIRGFNAKAAKIEKMMLVLATAQVILALAQIFF